MASNESKKIFQLRLLALFTVLFGSIFYLVGDLVKPGFSSYSQFISELNAVGTPFAFELGIFGFLPVGIFIAAFLYLASDLIELQSWSKLGWYLMWSHSIAFVSTVIAPCDAGCPAGGSWNQVLHNAFGLVTYFAGAFGIYLLSFAQQIEKQVVAKNIFRFCAVVFLFLFFLMLNGDMQPIRGVLQRIADGLLGVVILLIAWCLPAPTKDQSIKG